MKYPTRDEVLKASHVQLARWYRFLPSPGMSAVGEKRGRFEEVMSQESEIQGLIKDQLDFHGGMTPAVSKAIGWGD